MATIDSTFPPMAKICMIGIWIETVLYGANCVMYGLCMFTLLSGGRAPTLRWMLISMSTVHFLLCTAHLGMSLCQLLEAFVYIPPDIPNHSTIYWLDYSTKVRAFKNNIYGTLLVSHGSILIWRLYVIFMYNWRVIVLPIIFTVSGGGCIYAASALFASPDHGLYGSVTTSLIIGGAISGIALVMFVMVGIVARLWWMDHTIASLTATTTNRFASTIYIVVESGAISAVNITVLLALFVSESPAALSGLDVGSQLTALTPLLIVVQVGLTDRYHIPGGDFSKTVPGGLGGITFRVGIPQEQDSQLDISLHSSPFPSRPPSLQVAHV